jgi:signal transduction histidine kinase/CheY-like chemotaxis protein
VKAMQKTFLALAAVPISGAAIAYNVFERLGNFASTQDSAALHSNLQFLFAALVLGAAATLLTALVLGFLIYRNILVQRTAEAARLDEGALQKAIFNSANFSSIATDAQGVIQIFNVGAERMLGYAAKDVVNRITPADISDPQEIIVRATALSAELGSQIAPGFEALVFKASRGIEDIYELTYLHRDGSRLPAVVSVTALRDVVGGIIGYLLIGTDNTARKQIEADRALLDQALLDKNGELEAAKSAAERANLAKSDFLSNMSHELRTPLNAILGFAQLIESSVPPPTSSQARSVEQILKAGWYLLDLINEILDLALIESGKLSLSMEPITLHDLMQECQTMIEPQAQKRGITVTFPQHASPHNVQADRTRVKQILINLLSNAIKYNRERGSVMVTCAVTAAGRIRIAVEDTGAGLEPEKLAQLFQPFNRLGQESGTEQGTGIGLVVSRRLVELMGGEIGATSTAGVGSTFWIELNATDAALISSDPIESVPAALVQASGAGQCTLLYIEDNPANLMLVEDIVSRRTDIRLMHAFDGIRGVEMALKWLPDIILMDINLPGISGVQALEILAQLPATAHIPVVALSANALPRDITKGLEAGFFRYLTKPIKIDEFSHALDEALTFAKAEQAGASKLESAS